MESLGIYYDELDDKMFKVEKAGLRSAYHESFLTSLKKVMEIKNIRGIFWNKKLTTRKSREEIIKQKGFCRDDFDGRTYDWLILPNKATEREFWNYLQDKADKFKEEKEKLWIEKKNILIKVGFNPDDFITDPLIKYLDMKNFKDYIKSTSELLDKGVEKSLHNKLYAEIERIDKEEAKRKKDEEKTFNYH